MSRRWSRAAGRLYARYVIARCLALKWRAWCCGGAGGLAAAVFAAAAFATGIGAAERRAATPLALSCTGCHQPGVNSPSMPALNRLSVESIAESLRRSRDTPRVGSIMARFTSTLSDGDIDELAQQLGKASKSR